MRLLKLAVVAACLCCGAVAQADTALKTESARKHFELGEKLYRAADYPGALSSFVKAYKLTPLPRMLFNIARCHEVMARRREAIKYYLLYLEKLPKAPNRDVVELRIVNLTMQENTASSQPGAANTKRGDAPSIPSALLVEAPRPTRLTWRSTAGVVCLSVGGASMITGVIFGAMAKSRADEFKVGVDDKAHYAYLKATDDDGKRFETLQIITLAAGGAIMAGGLALLMWDRLRGQESAKRPIISPFAGDKTIGLTGRFSF